MCMDAFAAEPVSLSCLCTLSRGNILSALFRSCHSAWTWNRRLCSRISLRAPSRNACSQFGHMSRMSLCHLNIDCTFIKKTYSFCVATIKLNSSRFYFILPRPLHMVRYGWYIKWLWSRCKWWLWWFKCWKFGL